MEVNLIKLQQGLDTSINFTCAIILSKCRVIEANLLSRNLDCARNTYEETKNYKFILDQLLYCVSMGSRGEYVSVSIDKINVRLKSFQDKLKEEAL